MLNTSHYMTNVHLSPVQQLVKHQNTKTTYNMKKIIVMEWL